MLLGEGVRISSETASAAWPQIRSRSWMEEILLQLKFVNNEEKVNYKLKKKVNGFLNFYLLFGVYSYKKLT